MMPWRSDTPITQMAIDHGQNARSQTIFLQEVAKKHDGRVFRDAALSQRQLSELMQRGDLVERFPLPDR